MDSDQGASNSAALIACSCAANVVQMNVSLAAARADNEEMLLEVFEQGGFDINFVDGLGNTALHYAAAGGCMDVLEHILEHAECDVDPINRLERATPLHLAARLKEPELRKAVFTSLLDAGADFKIKDQNGDTAADLLPTEDTQIHALLRKARAQEKISMDDVANDDDDDGSGSGSGSEDD
ncbi:Ankyrin [Mycena kentingensis (nom. inval.)]|nr:Ankyrin [Mycena kentingensis (nom. inval.)]